MDSSQCVSKKQIMIKWKPPEPGWCNMNSDGSALSINGRAGVSIARQRGIALLEINVDLQAVVAVLKGDSQGCATGRSIIVAIRKLLSELDQVKISHTF
ncbi:hypothetical protein JHK87_011343 [Glycine soja]|nr:hypothetical protein JHK87_011343 [Glycine soja]